jgi:antitoxin component of MazEF toxin-antitoxin module
MRGSLLLAASGMVLMSVSVFAQSDRARKAEPAQLQATQDKDFKIKVKDDRVVVRDKSKPVRRALEEQYAKIAQAQVNKDIDAMRALRTPDFTVDTANGERWDLETSLNYSRIGFQQVQSNISISNTIQSLDVSIVADEICALPGRPVTGPCYQAVAIVHQQWSRMQMKAGRLRRVDTEAIQTETWVNTKDGWKLKHIGDVKAGAWYVDGKRIDPSKPYDPDAPEYRPRNQ